MRETLFEQVKWNGKIGENKIEKPKLVQETEKRI